MEKITKKSLEKMIAEAKITTVKHGKEKHSAIIIKDVDRELRFNEVLDDDTLRAKTLEFILSEPDHIRGFEIKG